MRKNPERVGWTVLWAAFLTFCLLVTGVPLAVRSHLRNATVDQDTRVQRIAGIVLVHKANGGEPIGVTESTTASPGDTVITDATSRAILDLFERSHITLYSNSTLELTRLDAPRYALSPHPNQVLLTLTGGLVRIGVALPGERPTRFEVHTPHVEIRLEEGSYRIRVVNEATEVTVVRGRAALLGNWGQRTIPQGTRAVVDLSGIPSSPLPAAQNLIENSNFQQPLSTGWLTNTVVLAPTVKPPAVEVVEEEGRRAVRLFRREADEGNHTEVALQQKLDRDVRDFDRLTVSVDLKLVFHSLSGGGQLSSEFPVMVRLDYKDIWGNDNFWVHGFYYQNKANYSIAVDWWGQPRGERIPQGVWYPYESENLVELLGENRPAYLTGITVYASGWNYDSLISEIQLIVE